MSKKFVIIISVVIGLMFLTIVYSANKKENINPKVTIGMQTSPAMALPMVAKEMKYFEKNGVNVDIKDFAAGKDALTVFLSGSLDYSMSGEVPVGLALANQNQKFEIPAQIVKSTVDEVRVVAIKDGSINNPKEYFGSKKRKLATSIGGGPEYYTSEFLKKFDIPKEQVEIIAQKPSDMVASILNGSVDAISIFDPVAFVAEKKLGDKAIVFRDSSLYSELYVLSSKPQSDSNTAVTTKIIKALIEAEKYLNTNPAESKTIVAKYTKLDFDVIDGIWGNFDFSISLTPTLESYLKSQFSWGKEQKKINAEVPLPDYKSTINPKILSKIDASKVEINR
jgi:sulfonate transport system substrate-binding protein